MKDRILVSELSDVLNGKNIVLYGFIDSIRKLGKLTFFYLRDGSGKIQVFFNSADLNEKEYKIVEHLRNENIINMEGILRKRPKNQVKNIFKGEYEIEGKALDILIRGEVPPFEIDKINEINESIRGRFRYIELRNEKVRKKIIFRSNITRYIREYFYSRNYNEIETPSLIKSTPEGARDFIVPSRNYKGKFYALPQSPQLMKQILMGSGFEKYFQIARCYRDEDLRADRQPEFSQLDVERAFIEESEIYSEIENMFAYTGEKMGFDINIPFPQLSYDEVMEKYASDKPDMRNPLVIEDHTVQFSVLPIDFVQKAIKEGKKIRGIKIPICLSGSQVKKIEAILKAEGAKGLISLSRLNNSYNFTLSKFADKSFYDGFDLQNNETILFQIGKKNESVLNFLRNYLGKEYDLLKGVFKFLWVVDFPLFEYDEDEKKYKPAHHPFTMPVNPEQLFNKTGNYKDIPSRAYDLILNGSELGSGSIRINKIDTQKRVFEILGLSEDIQRERFGFFLDAMKYGFPPHGGIALGIARMAAILYGCDSIHDFIVFPKTTSGSCPLTNSPSVIEKDFLDELSISIKKDNSNEN